MENIVAAKFDVESEGFQAITELRNTPVTSEYAVSAALLAKKLYEDKFLALSDGKALS